MFFSFLLHKLVSYEFKKLTKTNFPQTKVLNLQAAKLDILRVAKDFDKY